MGSTHSWTGSWMSRTERGTSPPLPAVGVDQVWADLRRHLDWIRGVGSVVFLAAQSRLQLDDLRSRAELWCRRAGQAWAVPDTGDVDRWLRRSLPLPCVVWLDLWDPRGRIEVLHALNELRIRVAQPGAGCLVLTGPPSMLGDAAREAADLWSVRSFVHLVGIPSAPEPGSHLVEELGEGALLNAQEGYRSTWRLTVPAELRSPEVAALVKDVERARRILMHDPLAARRILDSIDHQTPLGKVLVGMTRAEVAGLLDDVIGVEANLRSALSALKDLPESFRIQGADEIRDIAEFFGALDSAEAAAQESLDMRRELVEVLHTSESKRDLAVSLSHMGRIKAERGELDVAEKAYNESLVICRELAEVLGTLEAKRDLAASLNNVGGIAWKIGDLDVAEEANVESFAIRRELVEVLDTPDTKQNLATSIYNIGLIALKRGNLDVAEKACADSLQMRRELVEVLHTPESKRDLAVSLSHMGRIKAERGELDVAEKLCIDALHIRFELFEILGTPEAKRNVALSLDSVGGIAGMRGALDAAEKAYSGSLQLVRELLEALGTPQAYLDLIQALGCLAEVAEARGEMERAQKLLAEQAVITEMLDDQDPDPSGTAQRTGGISELFVDEAAADGRTEQDHPEDCREEDRG